MPYQVKKVSGGYKVGLATGGKMSDGKKTLSKKPLTKKGAERQKKAVEINEKKEPSISGLSAFNSQKLREHSKKHEGGMTGKHMKNMVKFMRAGDSFSVAHNKAKKLDDKKSTHNSHTGKQKKKAQSCSCSS